MPAPAASSRHLYTGHHQGHTQAAPWLRAHPAGVPLSPGRVPIPGFDADLMSFDASAVVHTCSSSRRTPDPVLPGLSRNAHHDGSLPPQLPVVWALRLHGEPGGPTSITGTARFVLVTFYITTTLLPGHTDS